MNIVPLAYRSVLAHLLPGAVGLYPVGAYVPMLHNSLSIAAAGTVESGITTTVYLVGAALIIGLCLDAIRYVSLDLIFNRVFYGKDSTRYMRNVRSEADLNFYETVTDTGYAFYQFYINTAFALCAMLVLWHTGSLDRPPPGAPLLTGVLMLVLLGAGIRASYSSAKRILHRFSVSNTKEKEMSNGSGHPMPTPPTPPLPTPQSRIGKKEKAPPPPKLKEVKAPSTKESPAPIDAAQA